MTSLVRPVTVMQLRSSTMPRSPLRNQPSASKPSRGVLRVEVAEHALRPADEELALVARPTSRPSASTTRTSTPGRMRPSVTQRTSGPSSPSDADTVGHSVIPYARRGRNPRASARSTTSSGIALPPRL